MHKFRARMGLSDCSPRRAANKMTLVRHLIFVLLYLLCTCQANSNSKLDVQGVNVVNNVSGENDDAIESIVSKLSSWMTKEKQKNAKQRREQQDFDEDIILQQQQQQPQVAQQEITLPFVTLAYAQTLDGMIAAKAPSNDDDEEESSSTSNMKLSSPQSLILTHHLRNVHDAILVGGSTFLLDEPRLNVRLEKGSTTYCDDEIEHPIPIVLDTQLINLQLLLFDKVVSKALSSEAAKKDDVILPDIAIDKIRAHNPIICCSSNAAQTFLDVLEVFQEQQLSRKRKKRNKSYDITVYKKIDMQDPDKDIYLPIKITINVTHHNKNENDVSEEVTLTLLPCPTHENTEELNLKHVLNQLYNQFDVESVMVEGGSAILSSFLNEFTATNENGSSKVVNCLCVTIAPKVIGGKWGLPSLGGFDVLQLDRGDDKHSEKDSDDAGGGVDEKSAVLPGVMAIRKGEFIPLGEDCIFLGRV